MDDNIFLNTAPAYYAKEMPVIPLRYHEKIPMTNSWQLLNDQPVEKSQQDNWLAIFPHNNIGLALGEQSGVAVIDIDDDDIIEIIESVLPVSPWKRHGQKGLVMAYRWNPALNTFRIKKSEGNATLVEYLSSRTQVVLPPSIHPKTQRPYTANCNLVDVVDNLPMLTNDVEEKLRKALEKAGYTLSSASAGAFNSSEYQSMGARDTAATRYAGLLTYQIMRGEITFKESQSLMHTWGEHLVESSAGDPLDIDKAKMNITRFLIGEVAQKGKMLPLGWDEGMDPERKKALGLSFEEEHEEWTLVAIKEYLAGVFNDTAPNDIKRSEAIDFILRKVARSTNLTSLDCSALFKFMKELDKEGLGLNAADFKKRVLELQKGPLEGLDHYEIAQAAAKDIKLKEGEIKFHNGEFLIWNGDHWKKFASQKIRSSIAKEYGHLPAAKKFNDHVGIEKTMRDDVAGDICEVKVDGINFANGFLTQDGVLHSHDQKYGSTYVLPYRYDPAAAGNFPKFSKLLGDSWGHNDDYEDKVAGLQEAMCTTLFGIAPQHGRCFLLYGLEASGKSQILNIVSNLVPVGAKTSLSPDQWGVQFNPSMLENKLVNIAGELSDTAFIDGKSFKEIVTGEEITGRRMRTDPYMFRPKCAHWFASNNLPKTRDTSGAFTRRWMIFDFDRQVPVEERVVDLWLDIVNEEMEAIVAWAVEGLARLKKNNGRYTFSESHLERLEEVSGQNSTVRRFYKAGVVLKSGGSIKKLDLYRAYSTYCFANSGTRPVTELRFNIEFKNIGLTNGKFKTEGEKYVGIAVKS